MPWTWPARRNPRSSTRGSAAPDLDDDDVDEIRRIIIDCGALQATEVLIEEFGQAAFAALDVLQLEELPKTALRKLAEAAVSRAA